MDAQLSLQLRLWQQQPSKQVLEALLACSSTNHSSSSSSSSSSHNQPPLGPHAQSLLLAALASPLSRLLPPNAQYITRLAKQLIAAAEAAGQELGEELLQLYPALLLVAEDDDAVPWRYKTFYYSSSPSWQQLQQLQQQQVASCRAACQQSQPTEQQQHHHNHQQQQQGDGAEGWQGLVPLAQLQQLQARQALMSELLLAAGQLQLADCSQQSTQHHQQQAHGSSPQQQQQQQQVNGILPEQHHCQHLQDEQQQQQQAHENPTEQHHCQQQQQHQQGNGCSHAQQRHCAGLVSVHMSANLFEGGTGCHMWDAGFLLAEWLLNHPGLIAGKTAIELGCGPGLVAACTARLQPACLLLTDGDPRTLVNCSSNMALNGHCVRLLGSWQQGAHLLAQQQQQQQPCGLPEQNSWEPELLACPLNWSEDVPGLCADIILGSDILYDPAAVPSVVRLLTQLLGAHNAPGAAAGSSTGASASADAVLTRRRRSAAYLSTTRRQASTLQLFEDLARKHGLLAQELPMQPSSWRGAAGAGSSSAEQPVVFQDLPALDARDSRYILHRVTAI